MTIKVMLAVLFVFMLILVAGGVTYGMITGSADAIGVSLVWGGFAFFGILAAMAEVES